MIAGPLSGAGGAGILAPVDQDPGVTEGIDALERADWESARFAFESVLAAGESADARAGLGQALWFLGDIAGAIAMRERAFEEHVRAGRSSDAARLAVWVSHQHLIAGRTSAARGWLARSERALEDADGAPAMGGWRSSGRVTPAASRFRSPTRTGPWRSRARWTRATSRCSRSACSAARR